MIVCSRICIDCWIGHLTRSCTLLTVNADYIYFLFWKSWISEPFINKCLFLTKYYSRVFNLDQCFWYQRFDGNLRQRRSHNQLDDAGRAFRRSVGIRNIGIRWAHKSCISNKNNINDQDNSVKWFWLLIVASFFGFLLSTASVFDSSTVSIFDSQNTKDIYDILKKPGVIMNKLTGIIFILELFSTLSLPM